MNFPAISQAHFVCYGMLGISHQCFFFPLEIGRRTDAGAHASCLCSEILCRHFFNLIGAPILTKIPNSIVGVFKDRCEENRDKAFSVFASNH